MNIHKLIEEELNKVLKEETELGTKRLLKEFTDFFDENTKGGVKNEFTEQEYREFISQTKPEDLKQKRVYVVSRNNYYLINFGDEGTPVEVKIWSFEQPFKNQWVVTAMPSFVASPKEATPTSAPAATAAKPRPKPRQEVKDLQTLLNQVLSARGLQTLKPQPGAKDGVDGRYGKDTRTKLLQIIPEEELKPLTIAQIIEKLKGMTGTQTQPTAQTESKCPKELPVKILGTPSVFDIYGIKYTVINSAMPKNSSQKMCVNLTEVEQKDDPSDMDQEPGAVPPPPLQYKVIETMALQESKSLRGMILKEILAALK